MNIHDYKGLKLAREKVFTCLNRGDKAVGKFYKFSEHVRLDEVIKVLGESKVSWLAMRMLNIDYRNTLSASFTTKKKKDQQALDGVKEL